MYAKLERLHDNLKIYNQDLETFFAELVSYAPDWKNEVLLPSDTLDSTPLVVIVATTKGLCGSLNSNLFRVVDEQFFVQDHQKPQFIGIGKKAIKYIEQNELGEIFCNYPELNSSNYLSIGNDIVERVIGSKGKFSSVVFYNNYLKTFFIQETKKKQVIPINTNKSSEESQESKPKKISGHELIWEQDKYDLLDDFSMVYLHGTIANMLFQALLSEQASRFMAMDSSTNNADKFLDKITLEYNKQRQSLITQEVSELSASMDT
jgi:F-type H+-transporting ATPase subunit gamma